MNFELGLKSCALGEQVLRGVESVVDIHVSMVATNTAGKILGTLSGFFAALGGHSHEDGMEDLVAEFLGRIRQFIGERSDSLDVRNHFWIAILDSLDYESAHAIHDDCRRAGIDAS